MLSSYFKNIVYIDLKTSNSSSNDGEILELSAIKFTDDKIFHFNSLIKNKKKVSKAALEKIDNLKLSDLRNAKDLEEVIDDFNSFIGNLKLVSYNTRIKKEFLEIAFFNCNKVIKNKFLDALELIALLEPYHKEYSLKYLTENILSKEFINRSSKNIEYIIELINLILERNDIGEFISFYAPLLKDWPWIDYLTSFNLTEEIFKLKETYVFDDELTEPTFTLDINKKCEESLKDIENFKKISPNYKFREAQYKVMKNVRNTLDKELISIIEAPTGTGKSIAYLLPSIIKAYYTGEKIFISTNTKELQRQLTEKDIPFLLNAFDLNHKVDFVNIKGKGNYLCPEVIDDILNESLLDSTRSTLEKLGIAFLHRYTYQGKYGDFEEINYFLKEHFKLNSLLPFCSADSDGCDINRCQKKCFYKSVVEKLKESSIVVLNHSLLLKWSYEDEIKNVIIDEAHNLSDSIFDAYAATLNSKGIKALLLEILDYNKNKGYLNYVWKFTQNRNANFRESIRDKINTSFNTIDKISYLSLNGLHLEYDLDITFDKSYKNYETIKHELLVLKEDLLDIYKSMQKFIENNNLDEPRIKTRGEILIKKVDRLKEYIDFIELYTAEHEQSNCYGYFTNKNSTFWEAYIKDLNSALIFFEKFLNTLSSCSFLSATLKNRNSYTQFKNSLAIDKVENTFLNEVLDVENTFDLQKRSIAISLLDSPRYYEADFIKYMVKTTLDILMKVPGNLLILFTSKKRLDEFKEKISIFSESANFKIYTGKRDISKLQDTSEKSILLGSRGFFEGIDIPGDSLSCVLMDKLPVINPSDPLYSKLMANGKSFNTINMPRVITSFKQCFGRLIRTEFDYGYFIVFDSGKDSSLWSNISREYPKVRFLTPRNREFLSSIDNNFIYWNTLNFDIVISQTIQKLENKLKENKVNLFGDSNKLIEFLNDFYKEELLKRKLNQNIILGVKNKKILAIYLPTDKEINLSNKKLILESINKCFKK